MFVQFKFLSISGVVLPFEEYLIRINRRIRDQNNTRFFDGIGYLVQVVNLYSLYREKKVYKSILDIINDIPERILSGGLCAELAKSIKLQLFSFGIQSEVVPDISGTHVITISKCHDVFSNMYLNIYDPGPPLRILTLKDGEIKNEGGLTYNLKSPILKIEEIDMIFSFIREQETYMSYVNYIKKKCYATICLNSSGKLDYIKIDFRIQKVVIQNKDLKVIVPFCGFDFKSQRIKFFEVVNNYQAESSSLCVSSNDILKMLYSFSRKVRLTENDLWKNIGYLVKNVLIIEEIAKW